MIENRTAEILAAIQNAARCTSDLLPLLETVRTEAGIVTDCPGPCESQKSTAGTLPRSSTVFRPSKATAATPRFPRPDAQTKLFHL